MKQLKHVDHPLVAAKLSLLRQRQTNNKLFRELVHEITLLLGYEATRLLKTQECNIETPIEKCMAPLLQGPQPVILPIMRAGMGMVDAMLSLMPFAKVGHMGLSRDEHTLQPQEYYCKIPPHAADTQYFICDPMLATGGSAVHAVTLLKEHKAQNITYICIIAAPEGAKMLYKAHPDVPVFCAGLDTGLTDQGFIYPGLGDAGDRLFGTI